jgi:3-oxoadipate enol-lactonase
MKFVKANGLVIHYLDEGRRDGPPIVFINALGCDLRIWTKVAGILAPEFRVISYDRRGHGLSESGPDKCEMADHAGDLMGLLDSVGVERTTMVGLSIGGVIAQELYRQRPERVAALALCDTAAKIGTDDSWDQRIAQVKRGGIEAIADSVLKGWFTADFHARRSAEFTGIRAMLTRTPRQGYLATCGALKRADLRPYVGRIEAPTLCLVGEEDGSTPVALVKETAAQSPARASRSSRARVICQMSRSHPSWRDWWPSTPGGPPLEARCRPARRHGRPQNRLPRVNGAAEFQPFPFMG